jgi:HK97 gp10 family phage protein
MNIFAKLTGVEEAIAKLAGVQTAVHAAQHAALEQVAIVLRDNAVKYVGAGHPDHPDVQTGRLRASIRYVVQDGEPVTAAVGTDMDYASFVEFGHHQTPGRFVPAIGKRLVAGSTKPYPFLRPAMDDLVASGDGARVYGEKIQEVLK